MISLEQLINRFLAADQALLDDIAELSGKVIRIELINTRLVFNLLLQDHGIHIDQADPGQADVLIKGTPMSMLFYVLASRAGNTHLPEEIEIVGDVGLAQRLQGLLQRMDVDWEERLSHITGDTLSRKTGNALMAGVDFLRQFKRKIEMDISEYALYEREVFPDEDEVNGFNNAVDVLRHDLERMKQRINKLDLSA